MLSARREGVLQEPRASVEVRFEGAFRESCVDREVGIGVARAPALVLLGAEAPPVALHQLGELRLRAREQQLPDARVTEEVFLGVAHKPVRSGNVVEASDALKHQHVRSEGKLRRSDRAQRRCGTGERSVDSHPHREVDVKQTRVEIAHCVGDVVGQRDECGSIHFPGFQRRERCLLAQQVVEQTSKRPRIGAAVVRKGATPRHDDHHFRRDRDRRAALRAALAARHLPIDFTVFNAVERLAEIRDDDAPVEGIILAAHHHVVELKVAMGDAVIVEMLNAAEDLHEPREHDALIHWRVLTTPRHRHHTLEGEGEERHDAHERAVCEAAAKRRLQRLPPRDEADVVAEGTDEAQHIGRRWEPPFRSVPDLELRLKARVQGVGLVHIPRHESFQRERETAELCRDDDGVCTVVRVSRRRLANALHVRVVGELFAACQSDEQGLEITMCCVCVTW